METLGTWGQPSSCTQINLPHPSLPSVGLLKCLPCYPVKNMIPTNKKQRSASSSYRNGYNLSQDGILKGGRGRIGGRSPELPKCCRGLGLEPESLCVCVFFKKPVHHAVSERACNLSERTHPYTCKLLTTQTRRREGTCS